VPDQRLASRQARHSRVRFEVLGAVAIRGLRTTPLTVRQFPLREGFSTLLARARQQTGSHADALRSLRETERALADLGLEPSPALRALEQQILTHAADTDGHQRLRSA